MEGGGPRRRRPAIFHLKIKEIARRRATVAPPPADEGGPTGAEDGRKHPPKAAGDRARDTTTALLHFNVNE